MEVGLSLGLTGGGRPARPATPTWATALANVASAPARILCIGDSTTAGVNAGTTTGLFASSYPSALVAKLTAKSHSALVDSYMGNNVGGGTSAIVTYDPRRSIGAGWALSSTTAGGQTFNDSTDTTKLSVRPTDAFDTIDVWSVQNSGLGSFSIALDGGSALQTVNSAGTAALIKTTQTVTLGTHTVDLARVSGSVFIVGVETRNSAAPKIEVLNGGYSGSATVDWIVATSPWSRLPAISGLAPKLVVINLGINDAQAALDEATFRSQYQTIITQAKTVADVVLVVPNPINTSNASQAEQDMIRRVITGLGASNNLRVVDMVARWGGSRTAAIALGFMDSAENLHPNATGYADMAAAVYGAVI